MNWYNISKYQKLSLDFIREFKDKVDWNNVSQFQELSMFFIVKFEDLLNFNRLVENKCFSIKEFKKYKEKNRVNSRYEILDL